LYDSLLGTSGALHLGIFEQPAISHEKQRKYLFVRAAEYRVNFEMIQDIIPFSEKGAAVIEKEDQGGA
jgi:hypothetical protein